MSHTPTPWFVRKERNDNDEEVTTLYGKRQATYAIGKPWLDERIGELDDDETAPDVAFLLNAVNSHQAMKEALEEILDYSAISDSLDVDLEKYRKGTSSYHPNVLRALHKAKQALTLANGEDKEP